MTYPVLAADILLYDADVVPVGRGRPAPAPRARARHRAAVQPALRRDVRRPEGTYGELGAKIMDLQDPESRMSTSLSSDLGLVKVLDPPDVIRRKIRSAVTDSGRDVVRAEDKPGVTNLIEIMAVATADPGRDRGALRRRRLREVQGGGGGGRRRALDPIRLRYGELRGDSKELTAILAQGAQKAHAIAATTLTRAHEAVGFVPPK